MLVEQFDVTNGPPNTVSLYIFLFETKMRTDGSLLSQG